MINVHSLGAFVALSVTLGLIGCRVSAPPIDVPEVGVAIPVEWQSRSPSAVHERVVEAWWLTFGDAQLNALIAEAILGNHDLKAAAARLESAAAEARMAGADLWPQANGRVEASRQRQNLLVPRMGGGGKDVMSETSNNFGVSLNVSWELDVWGRIRSAAAAAVANVQSQRADYAAATLSLAAQTTKSWFAVIESRLQVELAEATVVSYRETARQAKDRVEAGVQSPVDQDLTLANLASAEALLQDRRQLLDVALRQLEVLLGRYPAGLLNREAELPAVPAPVPAGLPAELLRRRPDLVSAERQVAAASQQIVSDQAALLPRISLSASGGSASSELQDILSGDFLIWSLASNLVQPVFEGGRLRARIAVSKGRHKEALEAFAQLALKAFSEVEIALAADAFLTERERSLETAATAAESAARVSGNRYAQGVDQLIVVLEGQRRALDAQGALLSVRRQRSDNRVDLHLALGGGFGPLHSMESAAVSIPPDTKSGEAR